MFVSPVPRPGAPVVLFCVPYAGAGPSMYHEWPAALGPGVDVAVVALPGREGRFTEAPIVDIPAIAPAMVDRAGGRPYAIYGQSMGGRVAFEVVRELRRRGLPMPVRLCVGGNRPPELGQPLAGLSYLDDAAMLEGLGSLGGLPDEVMAVDELVELVTPIIRADLRWLDEYAESYRPEPPLAVPLRVFTGADDPVASPADMLHWLGHAGAGLVLWTLPGDHFFVHSGLSTLVGLLRSDLTGGDPPEPADDEVHVVYGPHVPSGATAVAWLDGRALAATTRGHPVGVALGGPDPAAEAVLRSGSAGARVTHVPLPGAVGAVAHDPGELRLHFVAEAP